MNTVRTRIAQALGIADWTIFAAFMTAAVYGAWQAIINDTPPTLETVFAFTAAGLIVSAALNGIGVWVDPRQPRQRPVERLTRGVLAAIGIAAGTAVTGVVYMAAILGEDYVRLNARIAATLLVVAVTFGAARLIGGWLARRVGLIVDRDDNPTEATPIPAGQSS